MSQITYETGNAAPPEQIIKNKKEWLQTILEENVGYWVANTTIAKLAAEHGFGMNQITARISDLRDHYMEGGFGIYSEQDEDQPGLWRYKLDLATPEYIESYNKRRDKDSLSIKEKTIIRDAFKFVLARYPTQDEDFMAVAKKFGVKSA